MMTPELFTTIRRAARRAIGWKTGRLVSATFPLLLAITPWYWFALWKPRGRRRILERDRALGG
jgi:hypothetical protein